MSRILALVDRSPVAAGVRQAAATISALLGSTVEFLEVGTPVGEGGGQIRHLEGVPETALLDELAADDVQLAVLGSRSLSAKPEVAGHVALALLQSAPVPLLVVPPGSSDLPAVGLQLLVPLNGDRSTDSALLDMARTLADAGATVHVVHVYDSSSLPAFLESSEDIEVLAREFLAEHVARDVGTCELRIGDPASQILDVADQRNTDLVLVAWGQDLTSGRAEIVRRLLRSDVSLLLVPRAEDRDRSDIKDSTA